jgi:uncharacterized protein (UPF0303 family)
MSNQTDIALIKKQETELTFTEFNELVAHSLGERIRERALREKLVIVVDIRTWDRQLYFMALPGTTADNADWVRRKFNMVRQVQKASYRPVLENTNGTDHFLPRRGLDNADFVLAGGGFPIRVKGAGVVGCITVSGLHERDDHQVAVDGICEELGIDKAPYTLPPL